MVSNQELISFLKKTSIKSSFVDKLKIHYRPLVCPIGDLLELVSTSDSVFDIGCGSGQFALLMAHYRRPEKIHGIEISPKLVQNANELLYPYSDQVNTKFEYFDGSTIPDKIQEYNTILMIDVFHHIPIAIRDNFMNQVIEKMSTGTRLIMKDIDAGSLLVYFNKIHDLIFAKEIGKEISKDSMINLLKSKNLRIIQSNETRTFLYPHYTIMAQK